MRSEYPFTKIILVLVGVIVVLYPLNKRFNRGQVYDWYVAE